MYCAASALTTAKERSQCVLWLAELKSVAMIAQCNVWHEYQCIHCKVLVFNQYIEIGNSDVKKVLAGQNNCNKCLT